MMNERLTPIGSTPDITTCENCGKTGLKQTIILAHTDADGNTYGDPLHYGTTCAAHATRGTRKARAQKNVARDAEIAQRARKWLQAGHDPKRVATGIFSRYGRPAEGKHGTVRFNTENGMVAVTQ